ncbi:MAG: hypothetical protein H0T46_34595 [Deltaproteobacteria bacterium]|nr:hypothetical protein [Deltaproteobacteria bacterium]
MNFKPTIGCPGPHEAAGLVVLIRGGGPPVDVLVDVGHQDRITSDWTAALLDEGGRPMTAWMPVREVTNHGTSVIAFPIKYGEALKWKRVGLRIDQKLLDEVARRNTEHNM